MLFRNRARVAELLGNAAIICRDQTTSCAVRGCRRATIRLFSVERQGGAVLRSLPPLGQVWLGL
jgi:hypothetical protein